jgi:hypothetical protein
MTNLLHKNDKIRYSSQQMFQNPTVNVSVFCNSFVSVDLHVSLYGQQHPNCERAIRLLHPTFLLQTLFSIQLHKQESNGITSGDPNSSIWRSKQLYLGNLSEIHTCPHKLFFLTITVTITSQNIALSSRITLYSYINTC